MKRWFLVLLLFAGGYANAQTSDKPGAAISAGAELGVPSTSVYTIGLGFSAKGELPIAGPVSFTLTAAYSTFFYKSNLFDNSRTPSAAQFLPLKAGGRYNFGKGVFAEGEVGTVIELNYLKQDLFVFSVGPGFQLPLESNRALDISFRYESWSRHQLRQTAIRIGYRLGR